MREKREWEVKGAVQKAVLSVVGTPGDAVKQGEPPPGQYENNIKAFSLMK